MKNLKIVFLIIVFVLFSVLLVLFKPQMHKQVLIDDADFVFVQKETLHTEQNMQSAFAVDTGAKLRTPVVDAKTDDVSGTALKTPKASKSEVKQNVKKNPEVAANKIEKPLPASEKKSKSSGKQIVPSKEQILKEEISQKPKVEIKHELTEEEEIIVWNKWRSDLQNQVMRDTKISAPLGTGFKFSFTVDKFGKISNLKVWSTSPAYSELAVRVIKPLLLSYQGQPILNFPDGTRRVITNVTGGFRMATHTGYSTPDDYSDIERIKRLR